MSDEPRQQRRVQRIRRRDQLALVARFMSEPAGRAWFYDLLASCHNYQTSFSKNAMEMAFMEGQREVGLRILVDLTDASPDLYLQMLKEAQSERRTAEYTDTTGTDDAAAAEP